MLPVSSSSPSPRNCLKRPAELHDFERSTRQRRKSPDRCMNKSPVSRQNLRHRWFTVSIDAWKLLCETVTYFIPGRPHYSSSTPSRESSPLNEPTSSPDAQLKAAVDRVSGSGTRSSASDATIVATASEHSQGPSLYDLEKRTEQAMSHQNARTVVQSFPNRSTLETSAGSVAGPSSPKQSPDSVNNRTDHLTDGTTRDRLPSHRRYQNKKHIFDKAHKDKVQLQRQRDRAELEHELYSYQRAAGFQSSLSDFKSLLAYKERLDLLQKRDILSPSSSLTDLRKTLTPEPNRRHSFSNDASTAFLERALSKARETLNGPKPPKPFIPSFEQLQLRTRAKDADIERKLRPQLPESLPPTEEAEVERLFRKRGVIGKFAREQVSHEDIVRLRPGQWLNDEIINFYGAMILARSDESKENSPGKGTKLPWSAHYFSSFFWPKLLGDGYERGRLAKWTKKVDIFQKDIVVLPVNHGNAHWTAAAINFRKKRIEAYDSMNRPNDTVFKQLRAYLDAEHRNKRKKPFDFTEWVDYISDNTPQQENGFDCGVFTCQFMESLARGEETFAFTQRHMPYLRKRMVLEIASGTLRDPP